MTRPINVDDPHYCHAPYNAVWRYDNSSQWAQLGKAQCVFIPDITDVYQNQLPTFNFVTVRVARSLLSRCCVLRIRGALRHPDMEGCPFATCVGSHACWSHAF